ncbi:MAG TPA: DUF4397 domain-containing protein [Flavitalea sp.]|nr:DUF4397 domain-containing protein [Flavitalea sp.]
MKSVSTTIRKWSIGFLIFATAGILLGGCRKSDDDYDDVPSAGLMAFNLSPDKSAIGIALSGNSISSSPLNYTAYTGQYINIYTGNRTIEGFDYNSNAPFTNSNFNFEPDKYYSLFIVGADTTHQNIVVTDNFDSLSATNGKAYVRYINAIPDSTQPLVKISGGGSDVFNQAAAFASVSQFAEVAPGSVSINISNNGNINANRNIDLATGKAYTVLLIGKPGESNNEQAVQIKFIENGTLSDSTSGN